jgi:hypothetical protein
MNSIGSSTHLFQILGRPTAVDVPSINQQARETLIATLDRPITELGRCTLLCAPRAGYGKSHILCHAQETLRRSHELIAIQAIDGQHFDDEIILAQILSQATNHLPGSSGITPLDLLARRTLAMGMESLVRSGEIPCQNRDSALASITQRPIETFDFHHPSAVTAHWTQQHFDVLLPRLTMEIHQKTGLPLGEASFWIAALFDFASAATNNSDRVSQLIEIVFRDRPQHLHVRLASLLHLMSQWQRIVIVVDELEGLSANPDAALRLANFLTTLRHGAERIDVVLSLNDDIWKNAFLPKLSGGLQDRLTEVSIRLTPMQQQEALALLQSRYPQATMQDLNALPLQGDLYARGILRAAANHLPVRAAPPSNTLTIPPAAPTEPLLPPSFDRFTAVVETATPSSDSNSSWWAETSQDFSATEIPPPIVEHSDPVSDFAPHSLRNEDSDPVAVLLQKIRIEQQSQRESPFMP